MSLTPYNQFQGATSLLPPTDPSLQLKAPIDLSSSSILIPSENVPQITPFFEAVIKTLKVSEESAKPLLEIFNKTVQEENEIIKEALYKKEEEGFFSRLLCFGKRNKKETELGKFVLRGLRTQDGSLSIEQSTEGLTLESFKKAIEQASPLLEKLSCPLGLAAAAATGNPFALSLATLNCLSTVSATPPTLIGSESRINPDTEQGQMPEMKTFPNGNTLVVYESYNTVTGYMDIRFTVLDANKSTIKSGLVASSATEHNKGPGADIFDDNSFIITYIRSLDYSRYAQKFNADGTLSGSEICISPTGRTQWHAAIAVSGTSDYFSVFPDDNGAGSTAVMGSWYSSGQLTSYSVNTGNEISTGTTSVQSPTVKHLGNKKFIVAWIGISSGTSKIFFRLYDFSTTTPTIGNVLSLATSTTNVPQSFSVAKVNDRLRFVWADDTGIRTKDTDLNGNPSSQPEWLVHTNSAGTSSEFPVLVSHSNDESSISWQANQNDGYYNDVYLRRTNNNGPLTDEGLINTNRVNHQYFPSIVNSNNQAMVSWYGGQTTPAGIYFQIAGVSNPATLTNSITSTSCTENGSAVAVFNGSISSSFPITQLKMQVTSGGQTGDTWTPPGSLPSGVSYAQADNLTIVFTKASGTLTAAEATSIANAVTFKTTNTSPSASKTVVTSVDNGQGTTTSSTTLSVTDVPNPATLTNSITSTSCTENGSAVPVFNGSVSSSFPITQLKMQVTSGGQTGDTWTPPGSLPSGVSYAQADNLTIVFTRASGTLTAAEATSIANAVTFKTTNTSPSASKTVVTSVDNGQGTTTSSTTLSVTDVPNPAILTNSITTTSCTENGSAVPVFNGSVSSSFPITQLKMQVTAGGQTGDTWTPPGSLPSGVSYAQADNLTIVFTRASGTLTAAEATSIANAMTFKTTNISPNASKTVVTSVDNGQGTTTSSTTLSVTDVPNPAILTNSITSTSCTENGSAVAVFNGSVTSSFPITQLKMQVTAGGQTGDTWTPPGSLPSGVSYAQADNLTIMFTRTSGTLTAAEATSIANAVTFKTTNISPNASKTVVTSVDNGQGTTTSSTTLSVTDVPNPAILTNSITSTSCTENGSAVAVFNGSITSSFPITQLKMQVTSGGQTGDTWTPPGSLPSGVSYAQADNLTIVFTRASGTLTAAEATSIANAVTFKTTNTSPSASKTVVTSVDNGQGTTTSITTLSVTDVPNPAILTNSITSTSCTENGSAVAVFNGSITSSFPITQLKMQVTSGGQTGDTWTPPGSLPSGVSYAQADNLTIVFTRASGTLTAAEATSIANAVTFKTTNISPNASKTVVTSVDNGQGTTTSSTSLSVTDVPNPAILTNSITSTNCTASGPAVAVFNGSVSSSFSLAQLTIKMTAGWQDGDAWVLPLNIPSGITAPATNTDTLTFNRTSGTLTPDEASLIANAVMFKTTATTPNPSKTVVTSVDNSQGTTTSTTALTVTAAPNPQQPDSTNTALATLSGGQNVTYVEGSPAVQIGSFLNTTSSTGNFYGSVSANLTAEESLTIDNQTLTTQMHSGPHFATLAASSVSYTYANGKLTTATAPIADILALFKTIGYKWNTKNATEKAIPIRFSIFQGSYSSNVTSTVTVKPVNDPPEIVILSQGAIDTGLLIPTTFDTSWILFTDPDNTTLASLQVEYDSNDIDVDLPQEASAFNVNQTTGSLKYSGKNSLPDYQKATGISISKKNVGTSSIKLRISDGIASSTVQEFKITAAPNNPVFIKDTSNREYDEVISSIPINPDFITSDLGDDNTIISGAQIILKKTATDQCDDKISLTGRNPKISFAYDASKKRCTLKGNASIKEYRDLCSSAIYECSGQKRAGSVVNFDFTMTKDRKTKQVGNCQIKMTRSQTPIITADKDRKAFIKNNPAKPHQKTEIKHNKDLTRCEVKIKNCKPLQDVISFDAPFIALNIQANPCSYKVAGKGAVAAYRDLIRSTYVTIQGNEEDYDTTSREIETIIGDDNYLSDPVQTTMDVIQLEGKLKSTSNSNGKDDVQLAATITVPDTRSFNRIEITPVGNFDSDQDTLKYTGSDKKNDKSKQTLLPNTEDKFSGYYNSTAGKFILEPNTKDQVFALDWNNALQNVYFATSVNSTSGTRIFSFKAISTDDSSLDLGMSSVQVTLPLTNNANASDAPSSTSSTDSSYSNAEIAGITIGGALGASALGAVLWCASRKCRTKEHSIAPAADVKRRPSSDSPL
jgi:hypothetical protein